MKKIIENNKLITKLKFKKMKTYTHTHTRFDFMRNSMAKVNDICFEQANVLYNIGALHVLLGGMDNRVTEDVGASCVCFFDC